MHTPVQVVRVRKGTHRISWTQGGPQFSDGGPCPTCRDRAMAWERAGISGPDVGKWVASGFKSARDARPWHRLRLSPTDAATWAAVGRSATDAILWTRIGVTNGHVAEQWIRIGVSESDIALVSTVGMSPEEFEAAVQQMEVSVSDGLRLLAGTHGNVAQAQDARSLLSRFPKPSSSSTELVTVLRAGFSLQGTVKLLDQGVQPHWFWNFAKLGLTEDAVITVLMHGGVEIGHAVTAFEQGYSAQDIVRLADGVEVFTAITELPRFSVYAAAKSGINPDDLTEANARQFVLEDSQLRSHYRPHEEQGFGDCGPAAYLDAGMVTGFVAWFDVGIAPAAAKVFKSFNVQAADAVDLLRSGHTPQEVVEAAQLGSLTVLRERAAELLPWTSYFARSRAEGYDFVVRRTANIKRFFDALSALAVPHDVDARMFSDRVEKWLFLDGGVKDVDSYGFWGSSGVWVTGAAALRFLCGRLGLEVPSRLRGDELRLGHDQLEEELQRQRHDWATMAAPLRHP